MKRLLLILPLLIIGCETKIFPLNEFDPNYNQTTARFLKTVPNGKLCLYVTGQVKDGYTRHSMEIVTKEFLSRNINIRDCPEIERKYAINQRKQKQEIEARKIKKEQDEINRIAQAEQAQYQTYINQKRKTCKSYGYSDSDTIAQCVEREINAERARLSAQAAQQDRINQDNFQRQQRALRDMADTFNKIGEGTYGQPKTSICNFKSFEGGIISGDCKQLTIKVGNTTYWKMD